MTGFAPTPASQPDAKAPPRRGAPTLALAATLATLFLLLSQPSRATAEGPAPDPEPAGERGVVLVLSGGGARGAAHVGVLEVLEELQVPVDMVVGTSMGAVVGGLYAAGWSPQDLVGIITAVDWVDVFADAVPHERKAFRRKLDDAEYLVRGSIRFDEGRPYLPLGAIQGRRIELLLRSLELQTAAAPDFDHLPIPFRAVAADLGSSEPVVLGSGSLAKAIRASMSIPGAFAPVEIGGRLLVDGGVAANLPVRIARELGGRRIIAVDISSPLDPDAAQTNLFSVMRRMTAFLTSGNVRVDLAALGPEDVLVTPPLGDFTFIDFADMPEAIEAGRVGARAAADELRRFAVGDREWREWQAAHRRARSRNLRIDRLEVRNRSGLRDGIIAARLRRHVGTSLDVSALSADLMDLHGLELFGQIEVDVVEEGGERVLVAEVGPPPFGANSLRFGLSLQDDFESQVAYSLTVRHRLLPLNSRGGEWVNVVQLGETQAVTSELYQPLDDDLAWFVAPAAGYRREAWTLWDEGLPVSELWLRSVGGRLDGGRTLGSWGQVRLGAFWFDRQVDERIGPPGLVEFEGVDAGVRLLFETRTFDEVVFPRFGGALSVELAESLEALGAERDFTEAKLTADHAWTFGRVTVVPGLELYRSWGDNDSLFAVESLGGPSRLSGYGYREILGHELVLARAAGYAELFAVDLAGLETRLYTGASVEYGDAWLEDQEVSLGSLRWSGSVFVGADTLLGPMSLRYGRGERGRDRWYFNIGASF